MMFDYQFWRGQFISKLVEDLKFKNYLELGVAAGNCWNYVVCENKVGVDCENDTKWNIPNVLPLTTDQYFNSLNDSSEKFDVIFIDADHEKNQVSKDFLNSLNFLKENGIVIFHDIYPLCEENTRPNSCGNSYEFWISLVDKDPEKTTVFIGEPGHVEGTVGVYFNGEHNFKQEDFSEMNYGYEYFYENLNKYIFSKKVEYNDIIGKYNLLNN